MELVFGLLALVMLFSISVYLQANATGSRILKIGAILFGVTLVAFLYSMSSLATVSDPADLNKKSELAFVVSLLGAASLSLFVGAVFGAIVRHLTTPR